MDSETLNTLSKILNEVSGQLKQEKFAREGLDVMHKELDRLGVPRQNETGGLTTVYGRLTRITKVEWE